MFNLLSMVKSKLFTLYIVSLLAYLSMLYIVLLLMNSLKVVMMLMMSMRMRKCQRERHFGKSFMWFFQLISISLISFEFCEKDFCLLIE